MKRILLLLVVALASAGVTYLLVGLRHADEASSARGSLGWIREEFDLNDTQYAAVQQLHRDYSSICAAHCTDIAVAQAELAAASPANRSALEQRLRELEAVCNAATRAHLQRVAAAMPSDQGERFLRLVEPHLARSPHDPAGRDLLSR